jgi:hypothetical protein
MLARWRLANTACMLREDARPGRAERDAVGGNFSTAQYTVVNAEVVKKDWSVELGIAYAYSFDDRLGIFAKLHAA